MTTSDSFLDSALIATPDWQMRFAERFALEGILSTLKPHLAIEVGTAQGGSLRRVAAHSAEVHAFDLVDAIADKSGFGNVTFHFGDSAVLVPEVLARFAAEGRHVDFALIDGDHSADGVKRDALSVIESDACRRTVVFFHDTANDDVRAGLDAVGLEDHPKVAFEWIDMVPGYIVRKGVYQWAIWNGVGLVILDDAGRRLRDIAPLTKDDVFDPGTILFAVRDLLQSLDHIDRLPPRPLPAPFPAPTEAVSAPAAPEFVELDPVVSSIDVMAASAALRALPPWWQSPALVAGGAVLGVIGSRVLRHPSLRRR